MEIVGYLASLLIGISLGLIGGGGSILTVPVLVYLFSVDSVLATSYSLFIVGTVSLVGSAAYMKQKLIDYKTAMLFGVTSVATVLFTRKIIVPALPEVFFHIGGLTVTHNLFIMVLFSILMVAASYTMIKSKKDSEVAKASMFEGPLPLIVYGIGIGAVTGFLGAGGGFLIIPALVILVGLPMKNAVGTSLLIIALNSLIGFFLGDLGHTIINWKLLATVTGIAIAGMFVGFAISKKVHGEKLKTGFGWFVLVMGIYIIVKELFMS
jgi:uncharacterized protein